MMRKNGSSGLKSSRSVIVVVMMGSRSCLRLRGLPLDPAVLTNRLTNRHARRERHAPKALVDQWAHLGSNQGPPACEAGALPLSYAPKEPTENSPRHTPRHCRLRR